MNENPSISVKDIRETQNLGTCGKDVSIEKHSRNCSSSSKSPIKNSNVSNSLMLQNLISRLKEENGVSIMASSDGVRSNILSENHNADLRMKKESIAVSKSKTSATTSEKFPVLVPDPNCVITVDRTNSHYKDKVNNSAVNKSPMVERMTEVKRISAVTPHSKSQVLNNKRENLKSHGRNQESTVGGITFIGAPSVEIPSQVNGSSAGLNPNAVSTSRHVGTSVYPSDCTLSSVPANLKIMCKGTDITISPINVNKDVKSVGRSDCGTPPGSNHQRITVNGNIREDCSLFIVSGKGGLCTSNASVLPTGQRKRSSSDVGEEILNSPKKRMKPGTLSNFAEDSNCFGDVENCLVSKEVVGSETVSAMKYIPSYNFDRLSPKQITTSERSRNKPIPLSDKTIPANIMYSLDQSSANNQQKVMDINKSMDPLETLKTPKKNDIRAYFMKGSPSSTGKNTCISNKTTTDDQLKTEKNDSKSTSDKTPARKFIPSETTGNPITGTPNSLSKLKHPARNGIVACSKKLLLSFNKNTADGESENGPQHLSSSQKEFQSPGKADEDQIFIEDGLNSFTVLHFRKVIVEVLKDKRQDSKLNPDEQPFDERVLQLLNLDERKLVHYYLNMSPQAKELYLRMYNRKFSWHRLTKIKYNLDVEAVFDELEKLGFIRSDIEVENLNEMLDLLTLNEMKLLCKDCHLHHVGKTKQRMIEMVLDYEKKQTTLMFSRSVGTSAVLRKKVRGILGRCIRLQSEPRNLFRRLILMYFMSAEEDGAPPLYRMLQVERGELVYPQYGIIKMQPVFVNRDYLIRYQETKDMDSELVNLICSREVALAENMIHEIRAYFMSILSDEEQSSFIGELPVFLRFFSAGSCCAYALHHALESVKKLFPYGNELAVDILEELLGQNLYLPHYRGQWYEHLAQLYQKKDVYEAVSVIVDGMADELVDELHYYKVSKRGHRLLKGRNKILSKECRRRLRMAIGDDHEELPPFIQVRAKSVYSNIPGHKAVYVLEDGCGQEKTYLSVEELAITHYKTLGFRKGVHAEGGIINTIFGLFFWDIIYELEVPDVFLNQYQSQPLDMRTGEFYKNRKEAVDKRLLEMKSWSEEEIRVIIEQRYTENDGKVCIINWKWFNNFIEVLDLVFCMGMNLVAKLCERLVKSFRIASTGFPDIVLWTPGEPKVRDTKFYCD
ncbi:fanconi-associated nuclease 1 [Anabrus simplex]|uniref:fanconi-associated nuclease 1 n=1 Tax=Anabrus simplex TaxID=316456 RepID=UPI0035A27D80